MVDAEKLRGIKSDWVPEQDLGHLALIGKSTEELGEYLAVLGRCICQGVEGIDPETGEKNIDKLENEIADVQMAIHLAINRLNLDTARIWRRFELKLAHKQQWIDGLDRLNYGI